MEEAFAVRGWLEKIGLAQYGDSFESNGLTDREVVAGVTDNDLKDIGVAVLGHRKKLLLEASKLAGAGGAGEGAPASGGGVPASGGAPASAPKPVGKTISNLWKVTWDEARCSKSYLSVLLDTRACWFKQDGSAYIDGVTMGSDYLQLWNWEEVAVAKKIERPEKYVNVAIKHTAFDVWESQKKIVTALKPMSDGNILAYYDMDSGECKEIRKDSSEGEFLALTLLSNASPACIVASERPDKFRLFDANIGRPLASWTSPEWCANIISDPLQPNVFYALYPKFVSVFDKNVKNEVRRLLGMDGMKDIDMPCCPGNQLATINDTQCRIWDVGTGRAVHTINGVRYGVSASLYGNVVALTEMQNVKLYDLNESVEQPARELTQDYQDMKDICVLPSKVVVITYSYAWATTPFEA